MGRAVPPLRQPRTAFEPDRQGQRDWRREPADAPRPSMPTRMRSGDEALLVVTEDGFAKRIQLHSIEKTRRDRKGGIVSSAPVAAPSS
jgi:hypothetical protein